VHAVAIATGTRSVMYTPVKVAMISEGWAWRVSCGAVKQVQAINTAAIWEFLAASHVEVTMVFESGGCSRTGVRRGHVVKGTCIMCTILHN
jgi:hypothetical protein